ncbi:MAG TPA: IS110 family transposase [Candidatus Dormibacteraeota bacterium]
MVTFGGDCHKRTHTLVAVDDNGHELGVKTVSAVAAGHLEALNWARQWPERRWALENCRHLSRRLEADLLLAGEAVVQVSPKLMAGARRSAREWGKSDPIDALAVARAALRESELPVARLEGESREVKLLLDHRDDLVGERTRVQNRLRWHLHELEPSFDVPDRSLGRKVVIKQVEKVLAVHRGVAADIAVELLERVRQLTERINELEGQIRALVTRLAPNLLELDGCGALSAAKLIGETAGITRFKTQARFAMHNGSAPIPVWSGNSERHRLNRSGNRQINAALHRIALTQMRLRGRGHDYIQHRRACGDTKKEAIRALRRRISDEVFRRMWQDSKSATNDCARLVA